MRSGNPTPPRRSPAKLSAILLALGIVGCGASRSHIEGPANNPPVAAEPTVKAVEPVAAEPTVKAVEPATAEPVELRLARRPSAGLQWVEVFEHRGHTQVQVGDRPPRTRESALEAQVEVVAVDANSDSLRIKVRKHLVREWRAADRGYPPGTVIDIVRYSDRSNVRIDGAPAPPAASTQLAGVLDLTLPATGPMSDDVLFNTGSPRSVGDAWEPNVATLAKMLGQPVQRAVARLPRIEEVQGLPCAILEIEADSSIEGGRTVSLRWAMTVPLDPGIPLLRTFSEIVDQRADRADKASTSTFTSERTRTLEP